MKSTLHRRKFIGVGVGATAVALAGTRGWAADSSAFQIGHAEVDTTPPLGIELAGFHRANGNERLITGIRKPTAARALILKKGDVLAAIVSLDIIGVSTEFTRGVQERVAKATAIPANHMRICATHTHSMPTFRELRQWGATPAKYMEDVTARTVEAISRAKDDLSAAELYVGKSQAEGGNFNRTSPTWKTDKDFGKDSTDAERWLDTTLHVLRFERSAKPDVLWYHFACHPVCYGDGEAGPDWLGLVADAVRDKHKVVPAFLQGHAGDVNPGDGKIWIGKAEPTAEAIAAAFDRAQSAAVRQGVDEMRMLVAGADLPFDVALLKKQLQQYREAPEKCTGGEWVDAGFAKSWYQTAEKWDQNQTHLTAPISALRLGGVSLLFHPAELYSYYGLAIRRDSPFPNTLAVGYTDDIIGYLTDPNAYKSGEYAATTVPKILDLPPFAPDAATQLATEANRLLKHLAN